MSNGVYETRELRRSRTACQGSAGAAPLVVEFALDSLRLGLSPRTEPFSERHVLVLAEVVDEWPPIVVRRESLTVIDGHHRVAASRRLGRLSIPGIYFDGSDAAAYIESIRRNVEHGLVLPMEDRKAAALQILRSNNAWSDRWVAKICGLSPHTVGSIRYRLLIGVAPIQQRQTGRLGMDGRSRPPQAGEMRARILEVIRRDPTASLRSIAREMGVSPETVRSVRNGLRSDSRPKAGPDSNSTPLHTEAFMSTTMGRAFVDWFARTDVRPDDWGNFCPDIPLGRIYEVADEARKRASRWNEFADRVEERARSRDEERRTSR